VSGAPPIFAWERVRVMEEKIKIKEKR